MLELTAFVKLAQKTDEKIILINQENDGVHEELEVKGKRVTIRRTEPGKPTEKTQVGREIWDGFFTMAMAGSTKISDSIVIAGAPSSVYLRKIPSNGGTREEWRWVIDDVDLQPFVDCTKSVVYQNNNNTKFITDFRIPIDSSTLPEFGRVIKDGGCTMEYVELAASVTGAQPQPVVRYIREIAEPGETESQELYIRDWEGHHLEMVRNGNHWKRTEFVADRPPTNLEFDIPPAPAGSEPKITNIRHSSKPELICGVPCTLDVDRIESGGAVKEKWMWEAVDPKIRRLISPIKQYTYVLDGSGVRLDAAVFPIRFAGPTKIPVKR
jgi:hypothetical protein